MDISYVSYVTVVWILKDEIDHENCPVCKVQVLGGGGGGEEGGGEGRSKK